MVVDDADGLPGMARGCVKFAVSLVAGVGIVIAGYIYDQHIEGIRDGNFKPWSCSSDLRIIGAKALTSKGLTIDLDSAKCPENIPDNWPLTTDGVKYMRTFRSNDPSWTEVERLSFRNTLIKWAKRNKAKVLVGTQIGCNEDDDDRDWQEARQVLKGLGPEHTMALAVGNELDLLYKQDMKCALDLFEGGRLLRLFKSRVAEFRAMKGFEKMQVTSVFSGTVIYNAGAEPFLEIPGARVNSFFKSVFEAGETRWAFALNIYPYWSPDADVDYPGAKTCKNSLSAFACWKPTCAGPQTMELASSVIEKFSTRYGYGATSPFWIGEIGWSAPRCDKSNSNAARFCDEWSSYDTLYDYYKGFLQWNLVASNKPLFKAPEVVFYFTLRDSENFGNAEHFGLLNKCTDGECKLTSKNVKTPSSESVLAKPSFLEMLEAEDQQGEAVDGTVLG